MTMKHACWQHESTSEKMIDSEETPHRVYFLCGKSKPLGKKVPLPQLLTVCCLNGTSRTQIKPCPDKVRQSFKNLVSQEGLSDILGL